MTLSLPECVGLASFPACLSGLFGAFCLRAVTASDVGWYWCQSWISIPPSTGIHMPYVDECFAVFWCGVDDVHGAVWDESV